jgi:predicted alpha/beta-fold hydrolase
MSRGFLETHRQTLETIATRVDGKLKANIRSMLDGKVPINSTNIDDLLTGPMHGFRDHKDYRLAAEAGGKMHKVRVPSMWIHSWDDPLMSPISVPIGDFTINKNIVLATTDYGGHNCYFQPGALFGLLPTTWVENPVCQFLECSRKHLSYKSQ